MRRRTLPGMFNIHGKSKWLWLRTHQQKDVAFFGRVISKRLRKRLPWIGTRGYTDWNSKGGFKQNKNAHCQHLTLSEQEKWLILLKKYESFFDRGLDTWDTNPVDFELKEAKKIRCVFFHDTCSSPRKEKPSKPQRGKSKRNPSEESPGISNP